MPPENVGSLNSPGFMAFSILLAVITLVAGLMMGFTILAFLKASSSSTFCWQVYYWHWFCFLQYAPLLAS